MKVLDTSVYSFQFLKRLYKRKRLFLNCLGNLECPKHKNKKQHTIYDWGDDVKIMPYYITPSAYLRMN